MSFASRDVWDSEHQFEIAGLENDGKLMRAQPTNDDRMRKEGRLEIVNRQDNALRSENDVILAWEAWQMIYYASAACFHALQLS